MRRLCLPLAGLALVAAVASAQNPDPARVDQAVTKGAAWVKGRQQPDGAWRDKWAHAYPTGETALALLTLLKCGTPTDDPAIRRGFEWLLDQPFKKTYDVSVGILAVEALFSPKPPKEPDPKNPYRTIVRKGFQKADGRFKDWVARAAAWLVANQCPNGLWNYPVGGDADVSNMQFALLALKSARRLGVKLNPDVWLGSIGYLIEHQEKTGSKVPAFEVPAADGPIDDVEDRKAALAARAKEKETRPKSGGAMEARGWAYKPGSVPRGSMTAAGVACLVVCKSELEQHAGFEKKLGPQVDRAIRDGCAWLADRFKAAENPGAEPDWLFYYLYTLERAGTLSGVVQLGSHDWYVEGANVILNAQKDDGHFEASTKGEQDGLLAGSCLALLFLKRATVPVIERTATGVPGGGGEKPAPAAAAKGPTVEKLADGNFAVTFRYKPNGNPGKVTVAGSFNGWSKDATPCAKAPDGFYETTVRMKAGKVTYKFVVDGNEWLLDPTNPQSEDDGSGNKNSVLTLS